MNLLRSLPPMMCGQMAFPIQPYNTRPASKGLPVAVFKPDSLPCGPQSYIGQVRKDLLSHTLALGICSNSMGTGRIFSWNPEAKTPQTPVVSTNTPLNYPQNFIWWGDKSLFVNTSASFKPPLPAQVVWFALDFFSGQTSAQKKYSLLSIVPQQLFNNRDASGNSVQNPYECQFPKGMVQSGSSNQVWVALQCTAPTGQSLPSFVSRISFPNTTQPASENKRFELFFKGSDGQTKVYYNPTSLGYVYTPAGQRLAVVCSGNLNPQTPSALLLFDPDADPQKGAAKAYELENTQAGFHADVTFSEDGRYAILPTLDQSGKILIIDLTKEPSTPDSKQTVMLPKAVSTSPMPEKIMISQLAVRGPFVFAGNQLTGEVFTFDLRNPKENPVLLFTLPSAVIQSGNTNIGSLIYDYETNSLWVADGQGQLYRVLLND